MRGGAWLGAAYTSRGAQRLFYPLDTRNTNDHGIRKVLGSTVSGIVLLLSKDFIKYVLLANAIAWPLVYFAMTRWLQNYAYASDIEYAWFLAGGVHAAIIAWLTIGAHAVAASRRNPVNAMRQG